MCYFRVLGRHHPSLLSPVLMQSARQPQVIVPKLVVISAVVREGTHYFAVVPVAVIVADGLSGFSTGGKDRYSCEHLVNGLLDLLLHAPNNFVLHVQLVRHLLQEHRLKDHGPVVYIVQLPYGGGTHPEFALLLVALLEERVIPGVARGFELHVVLNSCVSKLHQVVRFVKGLLWNARDIDSLLHPCMAPAQRKVRDRAISRFGMALRLFHFNGRPIVSVHALALLINSHHGIPVVLVAVVRKRELERDRGLAVNAVDTVDVLHVGALPRIHEVHNRVAFVEIFDVQLHVL
mmetsp:Transcript_18260/g.25382  ORF Transcript_18260/g.25382 Transcript_18260/m.25382 type:complete len:291 (-) Transcript_18260:1096-1968(-)